MTSPLARAAVRVAGVTLAVGFFAGWATHAAMTPKAGVDPQITALLQVIRAQNRDLLNRIAATPRGPADLPSAHAPQSPSAPRP